MKALLTEKELNDNNTVTIGCYNDILPFITH